MSLRLAAAFAVVSASAVAGPASAQSDPYAMAHAAAANQLGVMEYCQGRGDVGPDAVAAQRSAIARLPASSAAYDANEALGKQGTLAAPNGANMTLDSVASKQGSSISALCKQMGSSVIQSAALQHNAMTPGAMTMPQIPAMPNGMTMPTMPTTPHQ